MTGVIINNNEYQVSTGSTKIEYSAMGGESVGYSMYGEEVPSIDTLPSWIPTGNLATDGITFTSYYISNPGTLTPSKEQLYSYTFNWFNNRKLEDYDQSFDLSTYRFTGGSYSGNMTYTLSEPRYVYSLKLVVGYYYTYGDPTFYGYGKKIKVTVTYADDSTEIFNNYSLTPAPTGTFELVIDKVIKSVVVEDNRVTNSAGYTHWSAVYFNVFKPKQEYEIKTFTGTLFEPSKPVFVVSLSTGKSSYNYINYTLPNDSTKIQASQNSGGGSQGVTDLCIGTMMKKIQINSVSNNTIKYIEV